MYEGIGAEYGSKGRAGQDGTKEEVMDRESFVVNDWPRLALLLIVRSAGRCKLKLLRSCRRRAGLPDRQTHAAVVCVLADRRRLIAPDFFFSYILFHIL